MIIEFMRHNSRNEIKLSVVYDTTEKKNAAVVKAAIDKALVENKIDFLETSFEETAYNWYVEVILDLDYWHEFFVDALVGEIEPWDYTLGFKASIECMQVYTLDM